MRVLVTGVSGFIGAHLAAGLVEAGHTVAGTTISRSPGLAGVEMFEADLLAPPALSAAVESFEPDVIAHFGGLSHVGESWKRMHDYFAVNVLGTENLLRAAPGCRVLFASTAEVYGLVPEAEQPILEDRQPAPQSPYALTKAAAERLVLGAGGVVVRTFNLVGPGQSDRFALPSFARQLAAVRAGERPAELEVGNLAARRDFTHVLDGVAAYSLLLERGEAGGVYNLGSGRARAIGEVLERLIELSGVAVRSRVDPERWRRVDLPLLIADTSRLGALGWRPRRTLDDALGDLWREVSGAAG